MARVFISHSSKDKAIATRIAEDLRAEGHWVWLDAWRIMVGQCIVREIEEGIEAADFVLLLLSNHAVESQWVDREWRAAYWDEVKEDSIVILPACIEQCRIPKLLQTKKYAAIYESYERGLDEVLDAVAHYEATKLNADFFHAVDRVRIELANVPEAFAVHRHDHWDTFSEGVESLFSKERLMVQKRNTEHYLRKYRLSVVQLKKELGFLGVYDGAAVNDELTDDVIEAIIRFQRNHNLRHADGVFGPLTYSEMEKVARSMASR